MLGVLAFPPVLLAENAVVGETLADQPAHRLFRRPVGDGHRIEGRTVELVLDLQPRAEIGQDRPAGGVGEVVEETGEVGGGIGNAHRSHLAVGGLGRRRMSTVLRRPARRCKSAPPIEP